MCLVVLDSVTVSEWGGMYRDVTTLTTKLVVGSKGVLVCNSNETKVLEPEGMQEELDVIMTEGKGRVFVRASNTEDVVRVFAECEGGREGAEGMAREAEEVVRKRCGGRSKL